MGISKWKPFKIKLCGFCRAEDVRGAIEAGTDAIGFNFCPSSPRRISPEQAAELANLAHGQVELVGVFVNPTLSEIRALLKICPLDTIQLHGDELPELAAGNSLPPIIKAVTWRESNKEDSQRVSAWSQSAPNTRLSGFLVDAFDPVQRGGTGKCTRWDLLKPRPSEFASIRLILAGGLTPENVTAAILVTEADAVDTASGIESAPGIKDLQKMKTIVERARTAFERLVELRRVGSNE